MTAVTFGSIACRSAILAENFIGLSFAVSLRRNLECKFTKKKGRKSQKSKLKSQKKKFCAEYQCKKECHSERSEESRLSGNPKREILCCAQNDTKKIIFDF